MFDSFVDRRLERGEPAADRAATASGSAGRRRGGERKLVNPPTRHAAKALIADWLVAARANGTSGSCSGFDFPFGYPAGFAARLGLAGPPWRAVWDEIAGLVSDDEDNRNNRFDVAEALNRRVSGGAFPFWGCPAGAAQNPSRAAGITAVTTATGWPNAGWSISMFRARSPAGSCWAPARSAARP